MLKAHRKARGVLALQLARDDALIFGDLEGAHRNPEHVSRQLTVLALLISTYAI